MYGRAALARGAARVRLRRAGINKQLLLASTPGETFLGSPVYRAGIGDRTYTIKRHEWCIPERRLAWQARTEDGRTIYEDTLEELADRLTGWPEREKQEQP